MADRQDRILEWYASHARDLPWRRPGTAPWAVLVSEVMLQQTPVARVLPVFEQWMWKWPTPGALAAASPAETVRAWGRLGYPRRALRLHAAAATIVARHAGEVPSTYESLLALPGVGSYTAAAVATFAFRQRHAVLDTNVRRVLARMVGGVAEPARAVTRREREVAESMLLEDPEMAARWSVAVMELGALICTAGTPDCCACPVADVCQWLRRGRPAYTGPLRARQSYAGTDRQCRGTLLAVLRDADAAVPASLLNTAWDDDAQRERCLGSLLIDGLIHRAGERAFALGPPARHVAPPTGPGPDGGVPGGEV